jgi:hypothetical protein
MLKIKHRDVEIILREATIEDEVRSQIIANRAQELEPDDARGIWNVFGDLCGHVASSSGLPFDPLTLHEASAQEVYAAYHAYVQLPSKLGKLWRQAVTQVDGEESEGPTPIGDADPNAKPAGDSRPGGKSQ